jgi:hypothetical protein
MSDDREPSRDELLGALLWLRNQYELGFKAHKDSVLKEADHILNKANVGTKHVIAFSDWMRRNWRDGRPGANSLQPHCPGDGRKLE